MSSGHHKSSGGRLRPPVRAMITRAENRCTIREKRSIHGTRILQKREHKCGEKGASCLLLTFIRLSGGTGGSFRKIAADSGPLNWRMCNSSGTYFTDEGLKNCIAIFLHKMWRIIGFFDIVSATPVWKWKF